MLSISWNSSSTSATRFFLSAAISAGNSNSRSSVASTSSRRWPASKEKLSLPSAGSTVTVEVYPGGYRSVHPMVNHQLVNHGVVRALLADPSLVVQRVKDVDAASAQVDCRVVAGERGHPRPRSSALVERLGTARDGSRS